MEIVKVDIAELNKAEWNYKTEDAEMAKRLVANVKRNGILQVSLIYKEGDKRIVLDGNHRLDAYRLLGIKEVPCLDLGEISRARAQRISIEMNETRFESDKIRLSEAIKNIAGQFGIDDMVESMPFSKEEMEQMRDLLDFDWNQYGDENAGPDIDEPPDKMYKCPHCGHEFFEE